MLRVWQYRDSVPPTLVAADGFAVETNTLLWLEASEIAPAELAMIAHRLGIDPRASEDLSEGGQRTKLESYGDHWHVALYDCRFEDDEFHTHELDVLFGSGWILVVHQRVDDDLLTEMRTRFERERSEPAAIDEGFALWAALDVIVDRWFEAADDIDDRLEAIEDQIFESRSTDMPMSVFTMRRALVAMRRTVSPTREVLAALLRRDVGIVGEPALRRLYDVNDHIIRMMELIESQRELLAGLLEAQFAIAANRTNDVMKATSSWGAILVVNTLIAGIYGMNFRHLPELNWLLGYPFALALMVAVTVGGYRLFKRRDWL